MKRMMKVLFIMILAAAMIFAALVLFLLWAGKQPAVKETYYKTTETGGAIEAAYTARGSYEVSYYEQETDAAYRKFRVWYPAELEEGGKTYPLVVMANGTGVPASKYVAIFTHLASWGFIVIGNEDENSRTGASSSDSLAFMLGQNENRQSIFYGKVDTENIGIAGHSQGGVGAINAVTRFENSGCYKAIWTASATSSFFSQDGGLGEEWRYDVARIKIPYFMVAGASGLDAGSAASFEETENQGICPLWSMRENFDKLSDTADKGMARRKDTDHAPMLYSADGYMTAWFMYYLQGDENAGSAFYGDDAEIRTNQLWQDVQIEEH